MQLAQELIKLGAPVGEVNNRGSSVLHFAIYGLEAGQDRTQLVSALLSTEGVDVNAQDSNGTTPLIAASMRGFARVAEKLLTAGADVTLKDTKGHDATWYAEFHNHTEVVFMLNAVPREEKASSQFLHDVQNDRPLGGPLRPHDVAGEQEEEKGI